MPPRRNKAKASSSTPSQSTISFNNRAHRVTKSSVKTPIIDKKLTKKLGELSESDLVAQTSNLEPEVAEIEIDDNNVTQSTPIAKAKPIQQDETTPTQPKTKKKSRSSTSSLSSSDLDAALSTATSIPDSKIKKYWKTEEDSRLAPRIHQQTLPLQEKILRHFDLSSQYGPCIGIPRLNRWKRAYTLNLNPPIEVLAVLLQEEKKGKERGVGGRQTGAIAYVDELGGGLTGLAE